MKKIVKGAGKLAGGVLGTLIGSIAKKKDKPAPAPEAGPKIMPLADDDAVRRARKKSIAAQMGRGGRSSTILSSEDKLGS